MAHIFQINASEGGVPKYPLAESKVGKNGLESDRQKNTKRHGGEDRALCLYSLEHILSLQAEGHPIFPGALGENITVSGLTWTQLTPGVRLQLGEDVIIEITSYTNPCKNVARFFRNSDFSRVSQKRHPGWARVYARVLKAGHLQVGDQISLTKQEGPQEVT
jgi:MOSC domain-containing protein YiiM